ncbi:zinc finger protein 143-like [Mytilus edulis]|uniref:zinc finger protein 143-like n=1 Tax=Mytilus edulis TaxID=6550 RepID=UPI0039EEA479
MSCPDLSDITPSEGSTITKQTFERKSSEDMKEYSTSLSLKSPVLIFQNGKQKLDTNKLMFHCEPNSLSNIYALAQANLVQQTQHDIMRMFSVDVSDQRPAAKLEPIINGRKDFVNVKLIDERQHICDIKGCGRSFASSGYLKNHQLIHEKEKELECHFEGCGRIFSWPAHLKYHLLTHQKTRNFKCPRDGCDKSFVTAQQLKVHSRTHTGEKPFQCDHCRKAFTTAGNLRNHIRTHTGDKPYGCPDPKCDLRFAEYSSLKKHSLVHTGEKPFRCKFCNRSFTQSGSMRVHMKKHSSNINDSGVNKETDFNVVMMEEDLAENSLDYQVVFPDSITDQVITVTTEQTTNISNEMLVVEDLVTKETRVHQETSCAANVLVVPLPQIPVTMTTSYQHTNTPEETVYDTDFLHSDFSHGGITCDIMLNEQKTISNS